MARVKRGVAAHRRHTKMLHQATGFRGTRKRLFRRANEAVMRSLVYQYRDRRTRKRDMRRLWIVRINAAARRRLPEAKTASARLASTNWLVAPADSVAICSASSI